MQTTKTSKTSKASSAGWLKPLISITADQGLIQPLFRDFVVFAVFAVRFFSSGKWIRCPI